MQTVALAHHFGKHAMKRERRSERDGVDSVLAVVASMRGAERRARRAMPVRIAAAAIAVHPRRACRVPARQSFVTRKAFDHAGFGETMRCLRRWSTQPKRVPRIAGKLLRDGVRSMPGECAREGIATSTRSTNRCVLSLS
ncbi:hypothetical protein [Cupriavidus sp. IDO]|uniref:hypothetical protein n=1 Tax=Cupriavidus sp. IDO TaxID=1539142 RepID=UPI001269FB79|nr:hypothetical protein [Cupriavidus sp. IDO]